MSDKTKDHRGLHAAIKLLKSLPFETHGDDCSHCAEAPTTDGVQLCNCATPDPRPRFAYHCGRCGFAMRAEETSDLAYITRQRDIAWGAIQTIKSGPPTWLSNDQVATWAASEADKGLRSAEEWCLEAAKREPDCDITVGVDSPNRLAGDAEARFMLWLMKEMPAGTVIGAPSWWSPRIFKAVLCAIEVQEQGRPSPVETFDGCPACAGAPNAEHTGQCSTVKSSGRSMTQPERDAMSRAADRSVTVVDPGYTNEALAHQPMLPKVKMEPMGEWFTCRCNELHTLGDGHVCAVKASAMLCNCAEGECHGPDVAQAYGHICRAESTCSKCGERTDEYPDGTFHKCNR